MKYFPGGPPGQGKKNRPILEARYLSLSLKRPATANPSRYELKFLLGLIAERRGNSPEAGNCYRQSLQLYPLNYKIIFRRAKMELLKGNQREFARLCKAGSEATQFLGGKFSKKKGLTPTFQATLMNESTFLRFPLPKD
ncbi:MAG: tetratricopeptide repeat protein [Bacillota bacterium]